MKTDEEYNQVVAQLCENAHMVEELLQVSLEQMSLLAELQELIGITEHDVKRSNFKVVE